MKAAAFYGPGRLVVEERDTPRIDAGEILVRIRAAAICGTDLRIERGGHFRIADYQRPVLGHELAGEVAEVGAFVTRWHVGQRVAVAPNIGCGVCKFCRRGLNNMCVANEIFGISVDGGFADYIRITKAALSGGNVFELPDHVSWEEAAIIEPLSCCYNAWRGLCVTPFDRVLIIGPGPIGAFFVQLAQIWGARQIIVMGRRDSRLEKFEDFGADTLINSSKADPIAAVMEATDGEGADVIVIAASSPELQPLALELLARNGRVNFFGGLSKGTLVNLDTNRIHYLSQRILGTSGSSNEDYFASMQLVANGQIDARKVITHCFSLDRFDEAFQFAKSGEGLKTVVMPG